MFIVKTYFQRYWSTVTIEFRGRYMCVRVKVIIIMYVVKE